jgi:DNA-binding response OmpR family regulator
MPVAGKNIFVIDDDSNIRELLTVNLRAAGYEVTTAEDGVEGLAKLRASRPQCVVLDVMMPGIDGWELCKIIRDDPDLAPVRILMLTAKDRERDRLIGIDIFGADEYMVKPFEIDDLLQAVGRLVGE